MEPAGVGDWKQKLNFESKIEKKKKNFNYRIKSSICINWEFWEIKATIESKIGDTPVSLIGYCNDDTRLQSENPCLPDWLFFILLTVSLSPVHEILNMSFERKFFFPLFFTSCTYSLVVLIFFRIHLFLLVKLLNMMVDVV